jgi:hypothetical protein
MKFIEKDSIKTSQKDRKAKKAMKDCQLLNEESKGLEYKINIIKSEIGKNKDELGSLEDHKMFLLELSTSHNANWVAK